MTWPSRYFAGLTPAMKKQRVKELVKRKITGEFSLGKSDKVAKTRKSSWTQQFHREYPGLPFKTNLIAKRTDIPKHILDEVYNRGRRAWQTSGSRPGVTAEQWGIARMFKFVLITKHKAPKKNKDPNNNLRRLI